MKRFTTLLTAMVFGAFVLQAGMVSAKSNSNNNQHKNSSPKQQCKCPVKKPCKPPACQPPHHCGTGKPGIIVDPVHNPPWNGIRPVYPVQTLGTTIVRDHRNPTFPPFGTSQGGVTVTNSGFGPIVRDHRGTTTLTGPIVRDHRGVPTLGTGLGGMVNSIGTGLERTAGSAVNNLGRDVSAVGHLAGSVVGTAGRELSGLEHLGVSAVNTVGRDVSGLERAGVSAVKTVGREVSSIGSGVEHAASSAISAVGDFFGF